MPKVNFNVPLVTETGEVVNGPKLNRNKTKTNSRGEIVPEFALDADGNMIQEPVLVKTLVSQILNTTFQGDDTLSFSDRAARGKLARKVANNSTVNYTAQELVTIQDLSAKVGSVVLIAQIDDLINGGGENEVKEADAA